MPHRLLPLLLVLLVGCSSTRTVSRDETGTSYAAVNRAIRGKVVRIDFYEGRSISVTGAHATPDSLTWVDMRGNVLRSAPMSNVREVSIVRAGRGALAGMLVGAVVGAGVGTARAYQQGADPVNDPIGLTLDQKLWTFPIAHALYGMLVSAPIGAIVGTHSHYVFPAAAAAPPPAQLSKKE